MELDRNSKLSMATQAESRSEASGFLVFGSNSKLSNLGTSQEMRARICVRVAVKLSFS